MKRILLLVVPALVVVACDGEDRDDEVAEEALSAEDAALVAGVADESHRPGKGRKLLAKLDKNADGSISVAEADGHFLADKFAKLDKNADGLLTSDELSALRKHKRGKHGKGKHGEHMKSPEDRAAHMFAKLDKDGDGAITQAEAAEHHRLGDKFAMIDADADGKVTTEELVAFKREHHRGKKHER